MYESLPRSVDQFLNNILVETLGATKMNQFVDNYDPIRTLIDGHDGSKVFEAGRHAFFYCWFFENVLNLYATYEMLEDDTSKRLYLYLISFRLAGHLSVRLPVSYSESEARAFENFEGNVPSHVQLGGALGQLKKVDFEFEGKRYRGDYYGLGYYLARHQYFYNRDGLKIQPESGDFVVDAGACTGDSALVFSNAVGAGGRVWAFDPVLEHCQLIERNVSQFPFANVKVVPAGLSNKDVEASPISLSRFNPGFRLTPEVPTRSLDSMFSAGEIEKVDFIKMDIEGSEMAALAGGAETIKRFRPKLAISLYHNPRDLFEIPAYLKELCPTYRFFLGHYTIHYDETVLYGCPS